MANTTNLNLEKPIGTDQALVSVINSNMDKIDTFAGSTNQALLTKAMAKDYGVYGSGTVNERILAMLAVCYTDIGNGQSVVVEAFFTSIGTVTGTCSRRSDILQFNFSIGITADIYYGWYTSSTNNAIYSLKSNIPTVSVGTSFNVTLNDKGVASVPSANIPTVTGKTRSMVSLANFSSADLSASQIPPTVIQTSGGDVYILGSPSKTYSGLQLRALFI